MKNKLAPGIYYLNRKEDLSGCSGTGIVAQFIVFDDDFAALHWFKRENGSKVTTTTVFQSSEDILKLHGHEGRTVIVNANKEEI